MTERDWSAWSREAVALANERNRDWNAKWGLADCARYDWNLDAAELVLDRGDSSVVADVSVVGTTSDAAGTFLWAWANPTLANCRHGLERVQAFGEEHDLPLLTTPEWDGGRPEALEMMAIAVRVLDAEGCFIDNTDHGGIYFVLTNFRERARS